MTEEDAPQLFATPEALSPGLKWERSHEIATHHNPEEREPWVAVSLKACKERLAGYGLTKEEQTDIGFLFAGYCRLLEFFDLIGYGQTREAAIDDLVRRGVIPHRFEKQIQHHADLQEIRGHAAAAQFALFAGQEYYPEGGASDFYAMGASVEELHAEFRAALSDISNGGSESWGQIVSLPTMRIISRVRVKPYNKEEPEIVWVDVPADQTAALTKSSSSSK